MPKLIPKGLLGISVWVEILIDKYYSHRPTERLLDQWRLLGLDFRLRGVKLCFWFLLTLPDCRLAVSEAHQ